MTWFALLFVIGLIGSHAVYFRTRRQKVAAYQPPAMERLYQISGRAAWHREQQEALAAECCRLFYVDPDQVSNDRDLCEDIVYSGIRPDDVVDIFATRNNSHEG